MKVRSWKELILYLLLGGAIIAYGFKNLAEKYSNGITYILIAIIMLIRAVPDAISEEKHEENAFRAYAAQWYCRGQFGFFAPLMPWLGLLLLILDGVLVMLLPIVSVVRVLAGLLLGAALLSVILYGVWEKRQVDGMDDEEQAQIEADYAIYTRHKRQMQEADRRRWGIFAPAVPLFGAVPIVIGLLLGMNTESTTINRISVLVICAGLICLFLGSWWQAWRLEHWEDSGKDEQLSDEPEQHL
ncbi:hypothetical protein [Butyricicoccus pullicaecorum]|uniref:hypothetical protein n=1 Tax=Butyricicoccus pullicaecorum TaxID=501571 RepID=UPI003990C0E5